MRRFCSIFNQLLQFFSRTEFEAAVQRTEAEHSAKGFRSWDHFIAMLFCQLADAQSLREICGGLRSCQGRMAHLGGKVPSKSTLSYANAHRPWELFREVFHRLLQQCQAEKGPKAKFRFPNKLLSIDATTIGLSIKAYPWAQYNRKKGAIKLHFTLEHEGYLPTHLVITTNKYSDLSVARRQRWSKGTIVVFDRGYISFKWFATLQRQGVFFVTRTKRRAAYRVVEQRAVSEAGVNGDDVVELTFANSRRHYPDRLRVIDFTTAEGESFQFLTNNFTLSAATIADIYKDRWQIESFFKLLKQNLRVKSFVGNSINSVWTQIWTALIAMLLIKYLKLKARFGWSLSNLVYFLRMNLLVYRDLWEWIHDPLHPPPEPSDRQQLSFHYV